MVYIVGENLENSRILASKILAVMDCGVGGNLVGSRTLTSKNLVATNSDVSDPYFAAEYNNGLQEFNDFGGVSCFGQLGGQDFNLDDLDYSDREWLMAFLDFNEQEEPSGDSSNWKLKRKFEFEENLYHLKKTYLDNPY